MFKSHLPEYDSFKDAQRRCSSPQHKNFHQYGGRGIEMRFSDFWEFYNHIGPRPSKEFTIDRIDNDGHYEIGNVRWATRLEQGWNRRLAPGRISIMHCRRGHLLAGDNLYIARVKGRPPGRRCRACNAIAAKAYKDRRRTKQQ